MRGGALAALCAAARAEGAGDPCSASATCAACVGVSTCGWCSTQIVYNNGSAGTNCASPQSSDPFTCNGIFSTVTCQTGYECTAAGCTATAPGSGVTKEECETSCATPPPPPAAKVYCCATNSCSECAPGSPGATSKDVCEQSCGAPPPQPTPPPEPPAPTPAPEDLPGGFICNNSLSPPECADVPGDTPGAMFAPACAATCAEHYECRAGYICKKFEGAGMSAEECDASCTPQNDPCRDFQTCSECLAGQAYCGWCSQNVVYNGGEQGGRCAGVNEGIAPFTCSGQYSTTSCQGEGPAAHKNCSVNLDLMVAMDGSNSIKAKDWDIARECAVQIVSNFTFGSAGSTSYAKAGLVRFTNVATKFSDLTSDKTGLLATLAALPCHSKKSQTDTGDALKLVEQELQSHGRSDGYPVTLVITDGKPAPCKSACPKALKYAQELKDMGVDIFAVAVGKFDLKEIKEMASSPTSKYVFTADVWSDLPPIVSSIVDSICNHPPPARASK